jgi:hypothetical protein
MDRSRIRKGAFIMGGSSPAAFARSDDDDEPPVRRFDKSQLKRGVFLTADGSAAVADGRQASAPPRPEPTASPSLAAIRTSLEKVRLCIEALQKGRHP